MKRFVFDEWLWADLNGDNGEDAQREAVKILETVFERCDQLVTALKSPFLQKFYDMAKQAPVGDIRRGIVKMFKVKFLENSEKLQLLQAEDLPTLPKEMEQKVKEDDKYLIRCYLASKADLLVTTDNPLIGALSRLSICCQDKKTFLSEYLKEQSPRKSGDK